MANFLSKIKTNSAVDKFTNLDLSSDHITTANWMVPNVAYSKEMVPNEKINIKMETFTRMSPLAVPTFGRGNINNRAFFVPFRTIFPAWTDFIVDAKHTWSNGSATLVSNVPYITNKQLVEAFTNYTGTTEYTKVHTGTSRDYDITVMKTTTGGTAMENLDFTTKGRQTIKILESLGYKINWTNTDETQMSALPLLAYCKVLLDWYWPSQYSTDQRYDAINGLFKYDTDILSLTSSDLGEIFACLSTVAYDPDYFTSAWNTPNGPNYNSDFSVMTINDPTTNATNPQYQGNITVQKYSQQYYPSNGTPAIGHNSTASTTSNNERITQFLIDGLKQVTDWMKRHQMAGTRALDRYLARFGDQLSAEKLNRSNYIGSQIIPLQIGDVTSQASTDGASLGQFAGKGVGYGNDGNFNFDTDEYGMLIIISTIMPKVGYYQGQDRNTMHVYRTDYYQPEFDNLGVQATSARELYVPQQGDSNVATSALTEQIFGYLPRYAEYKVGHDRVTGDYRLVNKMAGKNAWHLMRTFNDQNFTSVTGMVQSVNFVLGKDNAQYSRIFQNTSIDAADKFDIIHHFTIQDRAPMRALYDTYEFENKGKEITMDVNGAKLN